MVATMHEIKYRFYGPWPFSVQRLNDLEAYILVSKANMEIGFLQN